MHMQIAFLVLNRLGGAPPVPVIYDDLHTRSLVVSGQMLVDKTGGGPLSLTPCPT